MNTLQVNGKYLKRSTISIAMLLCLFLFSSCVGKYKEGISDLEYEISRLQSEIDDLEDEIEEKTERIEELEEIIDDAQNRINYILWNLDDYDEDDMEYQLRSLYNILNY